MVEPNSLVWFPVSQSSPSGVLLYSLIMLFMVLTLSPQSDINLFLPHSNGQTCGSSDDKSPYPIRCFFKSSVSFQQGNDLESLNSFLDVIYGSLGTTIGRINRTPMIKGITVILVYYIYSSQIGS